MLKYVLIPLLLLSFNSFAQNVSIVANDADAGEPGNNGQFTISEPGLLVGPTTVNYTVSGTATQGGDYASLSGSVNLSGGLLESSQTIDISIIDDNDFELTEEVIITLVDGPDYDIEPGEGSASLFIEDNEEVDVSINNPTDVNEGNTGTTTMLFAVTLNETNPINDVVIDYTISGGNEDGTGGSLTFLANTGTLTQNIPVTTNGDTLVEPDETISVSISSSSNGTNIVNATGAADFLNDDLFVAQITATDATAAEAGQQTGDFTISLNQTNTTGSPVTVNYTIGGSATNTTDYNTIATSVSIPNGQDSAIITITPVDDSVTEGPENVQLSLAVGTSYTTGASASAAVTIADDDEEFIAQITATDATASEAGQQTGDFTISLNQTNTTGSPVTVNYTIGGSATNTTDYNTIATSVSIPNGQDSAIITITPVDDSVTEGPENVQLSLAAGTDYTTGASTSATVSITDNDAAGLIIQESGNSTITDETPGGIGTSHIQTIQVNLATQPVNDVTVALTTDRLDQITVDTPSFIYTPSNFNQEQTFTITSIDNAVAEGNQDFQLTFSTTSIDPNYDGLTEIVSGEDLDNDVAGILVNGLTSVQGPVLGTTSEDGGEASFIFTLTSEPTNSVTIPITAPNSQEGSANLTEIVIDNTNWDTGVELLITGLDDEVIDGDVNYTITTGNPASTEQVYNQLNPNDVADIQITNTDDDTAGYTVTPLTDINTTEAGFTSNFSVVLDNQPVNNVVFNITSSDETEGVVSPSTLTFTSTNWDSPQSIVVTGQDDEIVDDNVSYSITIEIDESNSSNEFINLSETVLNAINSDNDVAGFTVEESGPDTVTGEDGTTDTFTVVLDKEPLTDVRIDITSLQPAEVAVSDSFLIFTPTNWDEEQTITVTGVDDDIDDDNQNIEIPIQINEVSSDSAFSGLPAQLVNVTNLDDDEAGIVVAPTSIATNEDAGTVSFTVSLLSEPTDDVNITLVSTDTSEGTVDSSVLLTPENYVNILVTVTILDDGLLDGPVTFRIRGTEVSSDDEKYDNFGDQDVDDVSITNGDTDQASITINDVTVIEGNANDSVTQQAVLTVTLNGSVSTNFRVPYSITDNTAILNEDYGASNPPVELVFNGTDGQTRNITINILSDSQIEPEESFFVNLGVPSNPSVTVTDGIGVVTIEDDDDCLAGTQAPVRQNSVPTAFCDDFSQDLDNYTTTPTDSRLKWSTQNTGRQNSANHLSSSVVSAPGTYYGFYYDEINQCVSPSIEVVITASETPSVGTTTNPNTSACSVAANGNSVIDLDEQLTGTVDAGIWEYVSGPIALNPDANNVVNFQGVTDGTYVYRYTTTTAVAPCTNQTNTVTIAVNDCSIPCDAGSAAPVLNPDQPTNFCDTLSANLNNYVIGNAPNGSVLTWSTNSDPLVTSAHRSPNVSAPGAYYGFYFDDADSDNSTDCASPVLVVTLELNDSPELIETQGETICGPGEVELTATATTGATINWFETETSTTILATGPAFVPTVTETTTYFVLATANGCPTERVAVVATVLEQPSVGIPTDAVACNEAGADNTTILDLDDTLEGEGNGVWSINTDNDPSNGAVVINSDGTVDFAGLPEGDYVFRFTTLGAEAPCTNQFVDVTVTVIDCLTDADEDGLDDDVEEELGTDPNDPDSDDDGILDGQEVADGTDPLDDCDSNGGTALPDSDCDNDGLTTAEEEDLGTNPNDADSDDDGLTDGEEVLIQDNPDTEAIPETATDPLDACDPFLTEDCNPLPIDLIITKIVDINSPLVGEQVVFTIGVENTTMDRAIDVVVSDVLDTSGFEYVSHNTLNGTYDVGTGEWYIPQILGEEIVSLEITVRVLREGPNQNTATLISSLPVDENIENNSETVTVTGVISDCVTCGTICNIYSPNGDGVNDVLVLNCHQDYPNSLLQIFDQYGNSVFEMRAYNSTWDGTGQNGDLPKGTYFYILDLGDGTAVRKGWLQIIR